MQSLHVSSITQQREQEPKSTPVVSTTESTQSAAREAARQGALIDAWTSSRECKDPMEWKKKIKGIFSSKE
ncbi:hypothetical protein PRIPAC_89507 [Pristionchus pacificus]|uniref:Uncharacterized protein n=1 Tax=Pristionchus pacificus TaxID=54126 RepID=A0A2A6CYZ8_PRIPA|nr:hypothetical protein PRIPAC_89507 [Pristionchus pacificus]|eukprot:PDM83395.1 hypothetical protein PRIPAC_35027 [Pristionchus pacificus]